VLTGATNTTDNASVSLHSVGPKGADGRRRRLLAVSETPKASYIIDPETLATEKKVRAGEGEGVVGWFLCGFVFGGRLFFFNNEGCWSS